MGQNENFKLKVCLLGDSVVGKTSLIRRFVENTFVDDYLTTIGTRTSKKRIIIKKSDPERTYYLTLLIWDIMGQINFRKLLHPAYLKGAKGAILVCDVTRKATLDHLDDWVDSLYSIWCEIPCVFIANKSDLSDHFKFGANELKSIASTYESPFFITSAKTGDNVENAFRALGEKIIENSLNVNRKCSILTACDGQRTE
jgi:small GTP-binding protein